MLNDLGLPEGFTIGKAIGRGDCFFDAVAQGLKQLKPETNFTVKSLREVCRKQALGKQEIKDKIIKDARNSIDDTIVLPDPSISDSKLWNAYLASIEYTAEDIERMETQEPHLYEALTNLKYGSTLQVPIWGRPNIEGRMICSEYETKLHIIENLPHAGWSSQLVDGLASRSTDYVDYSEGNTIRIINKGGGHFEPILREQILPNCYDTMASEKKSDSESVCFQQSPEVEMKDMTNNQMNCKYYKESRPGVEVLSAESTIRAVVDYEDRLSDKKLQYKQSCELQESTVSSRVAGSSSIDSGSVWRSALTDCRSTVGTANDTDHTDYEIVKRATLFVRIFLEEFEKKLLQYSEEAKPGSKIKKTGKTVDQFASIVNNFIPPNLYRLVFSKSFEFIGSFLAKKHRKRAKKVSMTVVPFKSGIIEILVEAGLEIFQSFETQFTKIVDTDQLSWERGIQKLAMDAVDRVMSYIPVSNETGETSINCLTQGVILGKSKRSIKHFGYRIKDKQNGKILITSELYRGVGIVKIDSDTTKYYKLREYDCAEKYGYRLPFAWELEKWWEVNRKYMLVNPPEKEEYVRILDGEKKKRLASSILKEINGSNPAKRKDIEELCEKIENLQTKKEESICPFLFNLDHLPQFFVERGNMLKMLNEKLDTKKQEEMPRMILIHGGYGVGKSELAKSYAYSVKSKGNVVWINAKSCSTLSNSFYSLAKKLGIPTRGYKGIQKINPDMEGEEQIDYNDVQKKNIESIVNNIYEKLQDVESYFIFDNASQYEEVKKFLPPSGLIFGGKQPYVLITSRNKDLKEKIEEVNLDDGFSLGEAIIFIERALGMPEDNSHSQGHEMLELAKKLKYLPLALKGATKYIKEEGVSISQYLERYSKAMQESNLDFWRYKVSLQNYL